MAMFAKMAAQGTTVLVSTHDPAAVNGSTRRLRIVAGRIEELA
jgi:predicted ABC-type transport system involved in lysophospholipase L1 biosynthesis ATPase subunit